MFGLNSHNFSKSLWGQTALMLIVLALVLAVLRAFRLWIRDRMVRRMVGEATASESIEDTMCVNSA